MALKYRNLPGYIDSQLSSPVYKSLENNGAIAPKFPRLSE